MSDPGDDEAVQDFWRLGHRRRWWQWNVLTLFAALFVLVWARELLRLSQTATWMICLGVLAAWFLFPAMILAPPREVADADDEGAKLDAPSAADVRPVLLAAALGMIAGVFAVGGFFVGVLSFLAAILIAAAVRSRHD